MKPSTLILLPLAAAVSAQLNPPPAETNNPATGLLPSGGPGAGGATSRGRASPTGGVGGASGTGAGSAPVATGGASRSNSTTTGGARASGGGAATTLTSTSTASSTGSGSTSSASTVATSGAGHVGARGLTAWGAGTRGLVTVFGVGVAFVLFL